MTTETETAFDDACCANPYILPETLTILATYKCTAACDNCCFDSNPHLSKRIGLEEIISFIDDGIEIGSVKLVVFSGGECFLLGDDLVKAVKYASDHGLITRCVTNGYWAANFEAGRKRLRELKMNGLNELNISTGDHHQKWVPQETVINAAIISLELELDMTLIMVEVQKGRSVKAASLLQDSRLKKELEGKDEDRFKIIESPWIPRNFEDFIDQPDGIAVNSANLHRRNGCDNIFKTAVITPYSKLGYCCGLTREQIPELNTDWKPGSLHKILNNGVSDFIKIWIFVDGPDKILAWAASKNSTIKWENIYSHHCHSCLRLFKDPIVQETIYTHYHERVTDVLMRFSLAIKSQRIHNIAISK